MHVCAACDRPILDMFLMNVLDKAWHVRCVRCSDCNSTLTERCFSRDGKLFCRNDFFRRFGIKCNGCLHGISPSDLVRRARNKVFHLKCFTCMVCQKVLSTGEELYILDENKFICKKDYVASKLPGSDVDDEDDFDVAVENDLNDDDPIGAQNMYVEYSESYALNKSANDGNKPTSNRDNDQPSRISKSQVYVNLSVSKTSFDSKSNSSISDGNATSDTKGIEETKDTFSDSCMSPSATDSQTNLDLNPNSNCSSLDNNDSNNNKDDDKSSEKSGNKRRGPRTTIKAKQMEILKASFNAMPKPTRHIREQLAAETGLNMRVIQVWFQNRRSKERRMKQLSAFGDRRHFFRGSRRMHGLTGDLDEPDLKGQGYRYFNENTPGFYPRYPGVGYEDFFPGQGPEMPHGIPFLPHQGRVTTTIGMEQMHHGGPMEYDGQ